MSALAPRRFRKPRRKAALPASVAALVTLVMVGAGSPIAAASSSDAQATHAYLAAQNRLARALVRAAPEARGPERVAAAQIARECPGALAGLPRETTPGPLTALSPRMKGEAARLSAQKGTIEAELGAAIGRPSDDLDLPAEQAYATEVGSLTWSNPAIAAAIRSAADARLKAASAPTPPVCADARAWAGSGFRALSASSRAFQAARAARRSEQQGELSLATLLKPYEDASDRVLARDTEALEAKLLGEGLEAAQQILELGHRLGLPRVGGEEPKQVTLGHGRTAAGTRFEVSSGSGGLGALGCHRAATVAYGRTGAPELLIVSGPNNPICLSAPRYRHPALFCEAGLETIQTAVPSTVRSATLILANGRRVRSRVVRVPRRDGGPAGIYAQQIAGTRSHAVSLVELDGRGGVVLTLRLPRYRCVKRHSEAETLPTLTSLASGRTPQGEAFSINAFGSINGTPFLAADIGVAPELGEPADGLGPSKAYAWSLKLGCAPRPFVILYGFLLAPGTSVLARTAGGIVGLTTVAVPASLHAKGPLVYGVFEALPSELTVLAGNGSTLHSEDLRTEDAEAAQFCEGFEEP